MRLPRMTTRRWIVTVVISASLMGIVAEVNRELRRAHECRRLAYCYGLAEKLNRGETVTFPGGMTAISAASPTLAAYYEEMKRKYERAAARPWLAVEPDRPVPEM
jgi:hypothetical protein